MEKRKISLGRGETVKPIKSRSPAPPKLTDEAIERKLLFARKDLNTFKNLQNSRMALITEELIEALEAGLSQPRKKN